MADLERSYIVYAIIVIVLLFVIALVILKFYPEISKEVGKIANDVFDIVPEEQTETVDSMQKLVSSVESCLSLSSTRCGCKLDSRNLPENYYILIKNTPEGATLSLLSPEDTIIGNSKLIPNAKIGVALHAYNSRQSVFSDTNINTIDSVCLYDQDIRIRGNSDNLMSTSIGTEEGKFYADTESSFRGLPGLYKVSDKSVCLVTNDLEQADFSERHPFNIPDASSTAEKEIIFPVSEIVKSGRFRSESVSDFSSTVSDLILRLGIPGIVPDVTTEEPVFDSFSDMTKFTDSYLQSAFSCTGESRYSWPVDVSSSIVSSCSLNAGSLTYVADTYELESTEGSNVMAQTNSEVSGVCTTCPAGEKWVELKYIQQLAVGRSFFKFMYSGLTEIKPEIVQGYRVRRGEVIGKYSGKVKVRVTDPRNNGVDPGCLFPSLVPQQYSESCQCPTGSGDGTTSCYRDSSAYFKYCWF